MAKSARASARFETVDNHMRFTADRSTHVRARVISFCANESGSHVRMHGVSGVVRASSSIILGGSPQGQKFGQNSKLNVGGNLGQNLKLNAANVFAAGSIRMDMTRQTAMKMARCLRLSA